MRVFFSIAAVLMTVLTAGTASAAGNPKVKVETSKGAFVIELYPDKAPISVQNFLEYTGAKFYDGTIFHRVIKGFMIQGGGFTADMKQKSTRDPIKLEAGNGLSNTKGMVAMARTSIRDSATAQFFVNHVDNKQLDAMGGGYAVFGKVIEGLEVVEAIAAVKTGMKDGMGDVPAEVVLIKSVRKL
jgi:peptidyl-prolyl cis-trans isomerase A (cyclophilin A)